MRAFLYHFHGLGRYDFSELDPADLEGLQRTAAEQDYEILPTVYLRRENLGRLGEVLARYAQLAAAGAVPNIAGFAIEGPLLGPRGGIPRAGRWFPTAAEWQSIARLGRDGLKYLVMAPDAVDLDDELDDGLTYAGLLDLLYGNGARAALGHFHRDHPQRSAERLDTVLGYLHARYVSDPRLVLTDHLYNDMPRTFVHAWRTPEEVARREQEAAPVLESDWEETDLAALLGPVPAGMLRAARNGLLMPCLNFDGYHVDLDICRKTFDYLGADGLIALTDHTPVDSMAREQLHRSEHNVLWLRSDGAVAASSAGYEHHRANMLAIGLSESEVDKLFLDNPRSAVRYAAVAAADVEDAVYSGAGGR